MTSIISSILSIISYIAGNALMAKWIGALHLWMRSVADPEIKRLADEEYDRLIDNWGKLKNDRNPPPPTP